MFNRILAKIFFIFSVFALLVGLSGNFSFVSHGSDQNFSFQDFSFIKVADASSVFVRGYFRSNGTYVNSHFRSAPDGNPYNNWSYPGNTNPYTGKTATGNPEAYLKNYYGIGSSSASSNAAFSSSSSTVSSYLNTVKSITPVTTIKPITTISSPVKVISVPTSIAGTSSDSAKPVDEIAIPENAHLNYFGNDWECDKGYSKNYSTKSCNSVVIPENAHLNYFGNDWECDTGYKKDYIANKCI